MPQWLKSVNLVTAPVVRGGRIVLLDVDSATAVIAPHPTDSVASQSRISVFCVRRMAAAPTAPFSPVAHFERPGPDTVDHRCPVLNPRPCGRRGAESDTASRTGARP